MKPQHNTPQTGVETFQEKSRHVVRCTPKEVTREFATREIRVPLFTQDGVPSCGAPLIPDSSVSKWTPRRCPFLHVDRYVESDNQYYCTLIPDPTDTYRVLNITGLARADVCPLRKGVL